MTDEFISQLPLQETLTPADAAEAADAVRAAFDRKAPIYPLGGGTLLDRGPWPQRPGLGLSLARLSNIVDYPAEDMTITIQAGVTAGRLATVLAQHGQRLAVDVPLAQQATIGGLIAVGHSGPRRFAYGALRDYVLGLEAIDGQGNRFSAGGRVVKNAAALNLHRLMVGALGTLGVVTQVTLMVRPQPECSGFLACDLPDWQQTEKLLAAMVHSSTLPAAIELLAGTRLEQGAPQQPSAGTVARLLVGFEGTEAEVQWMLERLAAEWRAAGGVRSEMIGPPDAPAVWQWLCHLPADLELAVLPAQTTAAMARLLEILPGAALEAHAGNGLIRVELACPWRTADSTASGNAGRQLPPNPAQITQRHNDGPCAAAAAAGYPQQQHTPEIAALVRNKLRTAIAELGGRVRILRTPPGATLTPEDVWGPLGNELAVIEQIKERFDPAGILNPGRFFFP